MSENELVLLRDTFAHIIPKYNEINDIIVSMLDFTPSRPVRIVDLGCGFGELSRRLLSALPAAVVFGLDVHQGVLQIAKSSLSEYEDRFLPFVRDLNGDGWSEGLASLDGVVSAFALDFTTHTRHRELIRQAYHLLKPGGRWVTGEFFQSRDPWINRLFHDMEVRFVKNSLKDGLVNESQIDRLSESTLFRGPHYICEIDEKIGWLRQTGFEKIDVPWRFLNLAIISGVRGS